MFVKVNFCKKVVSGLMAFIFAIGSVGTSYAQSAFVSTLPEPGTMVGQSAAFVPVLVKGMVVYPDKPLNFDFIVDSGNDSVDQTVVKEQSRRMAQYFLAAITVPEEQLWVNLSPYEKDRVIENELGQTVLGRDMLAQDYILKQVTSSLIYPEKGLGKEFWTRVYAEAQAKFGTTDIPVDTFNKVWIMPEKAEVFEKGNAVYVTDAKLKVMLDSDRTAMMQNTSDVVTDVKSVIAKAVMREVVLPAIEKEVNEGKNFTMIRQVYHAAILAKWYRELIQNTLLADAYVGKNKVAGVTTDEKRLKEEIYQRYIAAYKKGVFNYIKEEAAASGETLPRKYFSGGIEDFAMKNMPLVRATDPMSVERSIVGSTFRVDWAMSNQQAEENNVRIPVVVLAGKPGAGKTAISRQVSKILGPTVLHLSMGEFIREHTPYRNMRPLNDQQRADVYARLAIYLRNKPDISLFLFDNNPYGDESYDDLTAFLHDSRFRLDKVIEIDVDDETSIRRQGGRLDRMAIEKLDPQQRLAYYNEHPEKNVPSQLAKFEQDGLLQRVKNNEDDQGKAAVASILQMVQPVVRSGCRDLVLRLYDRLQRRLTGLPDMMDEDLARFSQEIADKGVFAFASQVNGAGPFVYPEATLENLLRQEAKLLVYAEPAVGDQANFLQASPVWDQEAALAMQESRKRFYEGDRRLQDPAVRKYWEEDIEIAKGKVNSFNRRTGREEISVIILVLADRVKALPNRLKELSGTMEEGTFEINIVLADPQNLDVGTRSEIVAEIEKLNCPVKLIDSNKNTIATNRNLGSSESSGKYIVFLDDDVRLSKRTIPLMVESLRKHPELGITQAVTYDGKTGALDRPKTWFSKFTLSPEVMLTNIAVGMVVATRKEIVDAVPFVPFWPNFGEDVFFGTQVKDLGFYLSFVYANDAFVIHEHVTRGSATRSPISIQNSWIHHALSYYFAPEYYDDLGQIEMLVRINKSGASDTRSLENFFLLLRSRVKEFLENLAMDRFAPEVLKELADTADKNGIPQETLDATTAFFVSNKSDIVKFKKDWLGGQDLRSRYVLSADNMVEVSFPMREFDYGTAKGFSARVNSSRDGLGVIYGILNAMRNNAGPEARVTARGTARAYLVKAMAQEGVYIEKTKAALERIYGPEKFNINIEAVPTKTTTIQRVDLMDKERPDLAGIRLGIDVGGKSAKLVAIVDGEVRVIGEQKGDSYARSTAAEHIQFVRDSINTGITQLASSLGKPRQDVIARLQGVGISWNAPVREGRLVTHYDALSQDEARKMEGMLPSLRDILHADIDPDLNVTIRNDGFAGAMGGSFSSSVEEQQNIGYLGLGTGLAFGFVSRPGMEPAGAFEIHRMKAGYEAAEEYEIGNELSVKAFRGLMDGMSKEISAVATEVISSVNNGDSLYVWKAEEMGGKLAEAIRSLLKYWPMKKVFVGGGIAYGKFGDILCARANHLLMGLGVQVLRVEEPYRGYESAIGAAYDASQQTVFEDKNKIAEFLTAHIAEGRNYYAPEVNVHKEFKGVEEAIVREQKRLNGLMDHLLRGEFKQNMERLKEELLALSEELAVVMEARRKFVELGVPVFHSHTNVDDDGKLSPEELVEKALGNNVTVLYITGHNRMGGSIRAMKYLKDKNTILEIFPGVEVDTPVLGAAGIVHFVVTGPQDEKVIAEMARIGEETFSNMQNNFQWRLEKMLSWADAVKFDEEWQRIVGSPEGRQRLLQLWPAIVIDFEKKGLKDIDDLRGPGFPNDLDKFKYLLRQWFQDVGAFVAENGKRDEIYNKLDVMGNWTDALEQWPTIESPKWAKGSAGTRRRAMRGFFDILYSDENVEKVSGAQMRRAEDLLGEFARLGCRITLAHPEYELFVIKEITTSRHQEFWDTMRELIDSGKLHAIGAGWSREKRGLIADEVEKLRGQTGKDSNDLPLVLNIPDYHGEAADEKDIRKGMYQKAGGYYVWEDVNAHDTENYFRDAGFFAQQHIVAARQALNEGSSDMFAAETAAVYMTNPYAIKDLAALVSNSDLAQASDVGGIDIQNIDVARKNGSAKIQFNDQAVRDALKNGFNGFTPMIIDITPVQSPLMILGVNQAEAGEART